jgi:Dual specificity phosphatase, catalytic domain
MERSVTKVTRKRVLVVAGILALLSGVASAMWNWPAKNWGVVEPGGIYRSGLMQTWQVKRVLQEYGIGVIVAMNGKDVNDPKDRAEEEAAAELGIEILRFPMGGDGLEADRTMARHVQAVAAICKARQEGKRVLVQCSAGANRTGGVVATYELLVKRLSPWAVLTHMRRYKYSLRANPTLLAYLNRNMPDAARSLVSLGVIKDVPPSLTICSSRRGAPAGH